MLQQLENNEFVLMMYISGELPDEERREIEQMLKTDSRLREQYEALREAWNSSMAGLDKLDAEEPLEFSREVAARKVGRMVRQWHAGRMKPEPAAPVAQKYRYPWWAIASSAMAASVIGFLVWWGQFSHDTAGSVAKASQPSFQEDPRGRFPGGGGNRWGGDGFRGMGPGGGPGRFGPGGGWSPEEAERMAYNEPSQNSPLELSSMERQVSLIEGMADSATP